MYTNKKKCKKSLACFACEGNNACGACSKERSPHDILPCEVSIREDPRVPADASPNPSLTTQKKKKKTITRNLNEVNTSQKRREHSQGISKRYETITIQTRNN